MSFSDNIFGLPGLINNLHKDTKKYYKEILNNGGAISNKDLKYIDTFVKTCYKTKIKNLIKEFSPFAGENINSAIIKLWYLPEITNKLTSHNSIIYDKHNGFIGNLTNQSYLDTNFIVSNYFSNTDLGLSIYIKNYINDSSTQIGTNYWIIASNFSNTTYFNSNGGVEDTYGFGFYSTNNNSIYRNGQILANSSTNISLGTESVFILGRPQISQYSNRTIGCYGIKSNMSNTEELDYYNAIQTLMANLNRSY